ncbi:MAG TPA: TraB/GumN family protein [Sphingomicrobium sp.]
MVNLLVAAAIAAATTAAAPPAQATVEPAMFVVHDADTTVYIFGTFHALDGKADWFNDNVKSALVQSDELVLETLIPEGPAPANAAATPFSAPTVTPSASFLATTRMAINAGRSQGMQVSNGADMVLRRFAEAEGKQVEGLETLDFQFNMFNHMPPTAIAPGTKAGQPVKTSSGENLSKTMADMQTAWKHGDQTVFVRMLDQLRSAAPATYQMMFTERNARWADWIAARMQTPGIVFVAVGAGHLAGNDSVLVRLAEHGIESQRIY